MNTINIIVAILGGAVVLLIFKIADLVNRIRMLEHNSGAMLEILKHIQNNENVHIIVDDGRE